MTSLSGGSISGGSVSGGNLSKWRAVCGTGMSFDQTPINNLATIEGGTVKFRAVGTATTYQAQYLGYGNVRGGIGIEDTGNNEGVNTFPLSSNTITIDATKKIRLQFRAIKNTPTGAQGYDIIEAMVSGGGTGGAGTLRYADDYVVVNLRGGNDETKGLKITACSNGDSTDTNCEFNAGDGEILTSVSHHYDLRINRTSMQVFVDGVELATPSTWTIKDTALWAKCTAFFLVVGVSDGAAQSVDISEIELTNGDDAF